MDSVSRWFFPRRGGSWHSNRPEARIVHHTESKQGGGTEPELPEWCDLGCPHAEFPPEGAVDGSDSCRTFLALWCRRLGRLVTKNARCAARAKQP
jgi:hypothetical protein